MTLWGGRFEGKPDELMWAWNASISFDQRLYSADIRGSVAYARALARAGLLTESESAELVVGLERVLTEFVNGTFVLRQEDEDIHTAVERRLGELVGPLAGKLHTGRSRNDQVATDMRLYLLEEMTNLQSALRELQQAIVDKANTHLEAVMPGYTHLQQAQPILFSHWLMSFFWKLQRDGERLAETIKRTGICPLGAGALAGNPYGLDRGALATDLGFGSVTQNSIDAVNDRDFVVEFLSWAALLQVHLSSLAEDLILWSSHEYGFVQVDDAYSTGSSIMPQKRNPDGLELMRGKSGRIIGGLTSLLVTLKGLPSAYNKDLQEDKEASFDAIDTLKMELPIATGVIRSLQVNAGRMAAALDEALLATDLADYLVRKGVPFRESHGLVGRVVKEAEALSISLTGLSLDQYQAIHPVFGDDLFDVLGFRYSVEARDIEGGTATDAVRQQIEESKKILKSV